MFELSPRKGSVLLPSPKAGASHLPTLPSSSPWASLVASTAFCVLHRRDHNGTQGIPELGLNLMRLRMLLPRLRATPRGSKVGLIGQIAMIIGILGLLTGIQECLLLFLDVSRGFHLQGQARMCCRDNASSFEIRNQKSTT